MAQANAQREPSMEEILASIRKIIEETDGSRRGEMPESLAEPDPLAGEMDTEGRGETGTPSPPIAEASEEDAVSQFRSAMSDDEAEPAPASSEVAPAPPVEKAAPPKPFSLSDVQRRLNENERPAPARPKTPEPVTAAPKSLADIAAMQISKAPESMPAAENNAAAEPVAEFEPLSEVEDNDPAPLTAEESADASFHDTAAEDAATAASQADERLPASEDRPVPGAIVSADKSRQVAGSFEELKDAFGASRRKSFDDMAAEMLRPMLQDWLDNNLPVLVEKLVREEIERIARG